MNRWRAGLTRVKLCVIVGAVLLFGLFLLLLPVLPQALEEGRRTDCMKNLETIGKALSAYRNDNGGYLPFSCGLGGTSPGAFNNAAASSLGLLYPKYLGSAKAFRCPSTKDKPAFVLNGEVSNRTWALAGSSYGYDPRVSRQAGKYKYTAIMADMDGSYVDLSDSTSRNHVSGQNVLYADGHIELSGSNFCANDPQDNIFAQDPWDADTDTFLVRGDLNNLTVSFDAYDHLK